MTEVVDDTRDITIGPDEVPEEPEPEAEEKPLYWWIWALIIAFIIWYLMRN